jgi:dipeptidyl aminopeptidase/acylaminoacyl peptidase
MPRLFCAGLLLLAALVPTSAIPSPLVDSHDLMALRGLADGESALALSPDGDALAIFETTINVEANRYQNDLILIDLATDRAPRRIGDGGDIILSATDGRRTGRSIARTASWSPDGRTIAFLAERDDRVEIWTTDRTGAAQRRAILPGDVRAFFWAADGSLFVETATARAILAETRINQAREGFAVDERFAPGYALLPRPDETSARQYWRLTNDAAAAEIARADYLAAQVLANRRRAWVGASDESATVATPPLGVFAAAGETPVQCRNTACTGALAAAWASADSARVVFTRLEGHGRALSALYVWTRDDNEVRRLRRADERMSACAVRADHAYCLQESATRPRRLISISLATGRSSVVYDPNPQWLPYTSWRVERLDATNADGEASFAHLVYPQGYRPGRRYPLVIVQYLSRGFLRGGVGGEAPIYPLAARGYFVLSVDRPEPRALNARMTADAVLRQTELDGTEVDMKLEAIERLLQQLRGRGLIDEDRIALTGMSDGAETLYAALLGPRRFAAAIAASPPRDPSAYWLSAETHVESMRSQIGYRAPWDESEPAWTAWWSRSAFYNADRIETPLMLNLAESEVLHAAPLIRRLRERGAALDAFVYPGAYHIKWLPSHVTASQQRTMAWIDFWLCGRSPPDEALATRWVEMRQAHPAASPTSTAGGC